MDDNVVKTIKEKFDSLPESIQELIISSGYQNFLTEIGKKYQLNVEQMGILERETTLVLMGLTYTKDFETELTSELNIVKLKASQIVNEIDEKIFSKVGELLKLMNAPIVEPNWEQNLNFVLSGGDYSAFIAPSSQDIPPPLDKGRIEEGSSGNNPRKMDDLRSKFTI